MMRWYTGTVPTLKAFSGPVRGPGQCGCEDASSGPPVTQGPPLVPTTGGHCGPGPGGGQLPGNEPVTDAAYQCSLGVTTQPAIDAARRINHELGLRPYRVFLVWQERDRVRVWQTKCELELIPVRVMDLDGVDLELSQAGLQPMGAIKLSEVSPAQVTEDDLRGYLGGRLWGQTTVDEQFFYEVRLHERCNPERASRLFPPGGPKRRRFTLGAEPFLRGDRFEWRIGLIDQEIARTRDGRDNSIDPNQRPYDLPRLVP